MKNSNNNENQRSYRKVAQKMLLELESGAFPPGARLPTERELSERYGVSRPTVREAIIALEVMGKVHVRTGAGVFACTYASAQNGPVGEYSPFEVTEARVVVECEAAALAASIISESEVEALAVALDEMIGENDKGALASDVADKKFHGIIAEATQNRPLAKMIEELWEIQRSLPDIKAAHLSVCKHDGNSRIAEHRAIYNALRSRDPQAARIAMREHFSRSLDALHATADQRVVEETQRQLDSRRARFSLDRIQHSAKN